MKQAELTSFLPDDRNANAGTERGLGLLQQSLERLGAGRSILVDKSGRVIAGNKTHEAATGLGLKAVVVQAERDTLVVVKRMDIDLDSPQGRELAIADNRVGEVSLAWDGEELGSLIDDGVLVGDYFFQGELAELVGKVDEKIEATGAAPSTTEEENDATVKRVALMFSAEQFVRFVAAVTKFRETEPEQNISVAVLTMLKKAAGK